MSGRSIFDITDQNFGRLDETIKVANDNSISLNAEVTEDLIIGDYEGDVKKKDAIALQGLTFNNVFAAVEEEPTGVVGVINYDGVDDYVSLSSIPDVTGNKTISFDMFMSSSAESSLFITGIRSGTNIDYIGITAEYDSLFFLIYVYIGTTAYEFIINESLLDNFLHVIISKTSSSATLTINGDSITSTTDSITPIGASQANIGGFNDGSADVYSDSANVSSFWNFKIGSDPVYPGQPDGNLDSAWANGVNNGTVNGSPSTIDIP
jgi:hypothetical protein